MARYCFGRDPVPDHLACDRRRSFRNALLPARQQGNGSERRVCAATDELFLFSGAGHMEASNRRRFRTAAHPARHRYRTRSAYVAVYASCLVPPHAAEVQPLRTVQHRRHPAACPREQLMGLQRSGFDLLCVVSVPRLFWISRLASLVVCRHSSAAALAPKRRPAVKTGGRSTWRASTQSTTSSFGTGKPTATPVQCSNTCRQPSPKEFAHRWTAMRKPLTGLDVGRSNE